MDNNSETQRVLAEGNRVLAEAGRVHAESNNETGRIEAEEARVHAEYEREHALNQFFKRAALGYLILAVGVTIGLYKVANNNDTDLRREINQYAVESCLSSRSTLEKYNSLVTTQIEANLNAEELNLLQGRTSAAKLNRLNVIKLKQDKLHVPTEKECQKLILRP